MTYVFTALALLPFLVAERHDVSTLGQCLVLFLEDLSGSSRTDVAVLAEAVNNKTNR